MNQAGLNRCLDAFIVALSQVSEGKGLWDRPWYTSTKELQLASLEFCAACRNTPTMCVTVEEGTPARLWMRTAALETRSAKRLNSTRVPVVRADGVVWKRSGWALQTMGDVLSEAKSFSFGHEFDGDIRGVAWPSGLKKIYFGNSFDQPITEVAWPASIEMLTFGESFSWPLLGVTWPVSLRELDFFGEVSLHGDVSWPPALRTLTVDVPYEESIVDVAWPVSLVDLSLVRAFDQPIETVSWPPSLERLELSHVFNHPIAGVKWPASLTTLCIGMSFDQAIDMVSWPGSLKTFFLTAAFNNPSIGYSGRRCWKAWVLATPSISPSPM